MATTLSGTVSSTLQLNYAGSASLSGSTLQENIARSLTSSYTNGTGTGQVDRIYAQSGTFTASTAITATFTNYTDCFGNSTQTMARIKTLYFANLATADTVANNVVFGGGSSIITSLLPGTSSVNIPGGGSILINAPLAVCYTLTGGTHDTFTFTPGTGTPGYEFVVLGCSA